VLLDYQPGRGQVYPQAFLGDYRGILVSDGYTAWRTLHGATHVGCMAHSRRRFVEALKTRKNGGGPPEQALRFFEQLYRIEKQARDRKPDAGETQADCIRRFRQQHSLPVLNALKIWLDTIAPKVLPDTKLGDAVSYTLNQWDYLTRYTSDGRVPIDNNILEREIRVFATGRKSWLFSDTADGAKASAVIYSLMLTCRACGVDPLAWLRHVLTELPQREETAGIGDLLPFRFSKTPAN
jgi:transposase